MKKSPARRGFVVTFALGLIFWESGLVVTFYSFNLKIAPEYRQWVKLRGKLYAAGWLPVILENPFDVSEGEPWGVFKIAGHVAGYYAPLPVVASRAVSAEQSKHRRTLEAAMSAVRWMYAAPFRTYKQTASKYKIKLSTLMRAARMFRGDCAVKVDPIQEVIDVIMADYQMKPRAYTLAQLSARYGLSAPTISKRIRRSYPRAQWPLCLERVRRRE